MQMQSVMTGSLTFHEEFCPAFVWDRVSFHKKPGGDTTKTADPD